MENGNQNKLRPYPQKAYPLNKPEKKKQNNSNMYCQDKAKHMMLLRYICGMPKLDKGSE